jgi:hypothetical protein
MSVTTTILQVLHGVGGHRLNRTVLLAEVRIRMNGCGESDFHTAIQNLSAANMIESEEDDLTGDLYFLITPLGTARIQGGK